MHTREVAAGGGTGTDKAHLAVISATTPLILGAMGFGAAAFGKGFRRYSVASLLASLVAGGLSATQGRDLGANRPTPWGGVYERTMISVYLLWMSVLAVVLQRGHAQPRRQAAAEASGTMKLARKEGLDMPSKIEVGPGDPPAGAGDGGAAGMGTARHGRAVTVMVELILAEQTLLIVLDDEKGRDTTGEAVPGWPPRCCSTSLASS